MSIPTDETKEEKVRNCEEKSDDATNTIKQISRTTTCSSILVRSSLNSVPRLTMSSRSRLATTRSRLLEISED